MYKEPLEYFGTDGIRGKVGVHPITPEFFLKLGWAIGQVLGRYGSKQVILGKDTRLSGYLLESAVEAGLAAAGVSGHLTGPMPTPAIAYLTRTFRASAGIVLSASHNPFQDNGLKLFSSNGFKLPQSLEREIEQQLKKPMYCVCSEELGRASRITDAAGRYIEFCKATLPRQFTLNGLKIALDCANGATYHIAPKVLTELGATVVTMAANPSGFNINEDCGATDTQALEKLVRQTHADVGVALDGDGDRVILVNHSGQALDGDSLLYLLAKEAQFQKQLVGGVVGTTMTNLGLERALEAEGIPFERSEVGDRCLLEKLQTLGWRLGAESCGHIVLLEKTTTGDGIVAALQILAILQRTGKSLAELGKPLTLLPKKQLNFALSCPPKQLIESTVMQKAFKAVQLKLTGVGRMVVRVSGTERLLRVLIELEGSQERLNEYAAIISEAAETYSAPPG